ncbi:OLC1v1002757C1 [Oldenlandia corymbosa var. corymbosa]|uniref:OLC1v1002757C1 n=1 Tax=Oldenlandia corymbosa var. corymbosa TaxID=529605 RepID=A0AAV1DA33_OLDCO|nr:OLC1v1002757C1 [Oldenlandia corymbosa var. corymbosa]
MRAMGFQVCAFYGLLISFILLFLSHLGAAQAPSRNVSAPFNKTSFPLNFIFGAASSAYQYEGAASEDGKGPSTCDTFTHNNPDKIVDHSTGDVADDFYHRYKEDVQLMDYIGLSGFRFSISWSRVLPGGKLSKGVNKLGIAFYNNLINELLSKGITPFVTLHHWDTPQALEDEYGGFLSKDIVNDFRDYAELCFKEFGDRVKYWSTFNEPWSYSTGGYDSTTAIGTIGPGRCSSWLNKCPAGDSSTEPYLVAHHILLSHAATAKLYNDKYKTLQKGQLGIVLVTNWMMPYDPNSPADAAAAIRGMDFFLGWFLEPLLFGDYPKVMRELVATRLPKFTAEEALMVKRSIDFLGLNYYTSNWATDDIPPSNTPNISYTTDVRINNIQIKNGKPIGAPTGAGILYVYPRGLTELLVYIKHKYKSPTIYVTENGYAEVNIDTVEQGTKDVERMNFYQSHFRALKAAIDKGVDVKGFFAWSFMDTFEWGSGLAMRMGINFVDYKNDLKRTPKMSALCMNPIEEKHQKIESHGTSTSSAYQYEGAAFEDGKGPSICDTFVHNNPDKIVDHSTGDVADDFYHRYKDDVKLMEYIGLNGFRFSISWARVLPQGKLSKGVNPLGIAFYNNLINELLSKGIIPFVTLHHWDTPQALEDEYGGFRSTNIVDDFRDFAELCFKEFGDRVKFWSTFNEPWSFSTGGYDSTTAIGTIAPGRCSAWLNKCPAGDSSTEPYIVAHHILLSHAAAAKLYKDKYKASQNGQVGIVLVTNWVIPYDPNSKADAEAAVRSIDFFLGWFLDPLVYGDYPKSMRQNVGSRLPTFTAEETSLVKGSLDFLGLNYYTANWAAALPPSNSLNISWTSDTGVNNTQIKNGRPIGAPTGAGILYVYPRGLTELLVYIKGKYQSPTIYITENGYAEVNIDTVEQGVKDVERTNFYRSHFRALKAAIDKGVDVRGFFAWTFMDTFEWGSGLAMRMGINFVDYKNNLKRTPKMSALWYKLFLTK